jgi:hypothetical protein
MGPESAHEQTEVEVTPSQADAARLIIEIDAAAGKQTPGPIHKIAGARPSRRSVASGSSEDEPTSDAALSITLLPTQAPDQGRRQKTSSPRHLRPFGRRTRLNRPPETR